MEDTPTNRRKRSVKEKSTLPLVSRAGINQLTFRILLTGPENVIPALARQVKKCIIETHNIKDVVVHYSVSLNKEIALNLRETGLHGVVLCADASKSTTIPSIQETLKYLDFDLISTSLFIVNLVQPSLSVFSSVADGIEKLSIAYNTPIINIVFEHEESVKFGLDRVCTAALRRARFIYGFEHPNLNEFDFLQLCDSSS
ncbi:hypothetical protein GHT06_022486 [Daphnia sinensis]|uniref:Centromere protein M n=1 Tax=Daphnia sinensis TaxID=1820382 RepID=A0AAD5PPJ6_9CRUS|nr:hypothetical protein GHT06_022486 [Daphnia sinensis]